jgi:hypothetical protein
MGQSVLGHREFARKGDEGVDPLDIYAQTRAEAPSDGAVAREDSMVGSAEA